MSDMGHLFVCLFIGHIHQTTGGVIENNKQVGNQTLELGKNRQEGNRPSLPEPERDNGQYRNQEYDNNVLVVR